MVKNIDHFINIYNKELNRDSCLTILIHYITLFTYQNCKESVVLDICFCLICIILIENIAYIFSGCDTMQLKESGGSNSLMLPKLDLVPMELRHQYAFWDFYFFHILDPTKSYSRTLITFQGGYVWPSL